MSDKKSKRTAISFRKWYAEHHDIIVAGLECGRTSADLIPVIVNGVMLRVWRSFRKSGRPDGSKLCSLILSERYGVEAMNKEIQNSCLDEIEANGLPA